MYLCVCAFSTVFLIFIVVLMCVRMSVFLSLLSLLCVFSVRSLLCVCLCVFHFVFVCLFLLDCMCLFVCVCVCVCVCDNEPCHKTWICSAEEFLELYGKVEAVVENCLLM